MHLRIALRLALFIFIFHFLGSVCVVMDVALFVAILPFFEVSALLFATCRFFPMFAATRFLALFPATGFFAMFATA